MKRFTFKFSFGLLCVAIFCSCSNSHESSVNKNVEKDSLKNGQNEPLDFLKSGNKEGVIGVFNVPEMLTVCKMDSAPSRDASFKIAKSFSLLEEEMNAIGAKLDGAPGMITYNNDTTNFVFECVLPIKEFPKKQPKSCKIIVLEATQMLIYNFYGPYQNLHSAYDVIRKYNTDNKLEITGPMREFYLSDPIAEKDPNKWQTRIMVPVSKTK